MSASSYVGRGFSNVEDNQNPFTDQKNYQDFNFDARSVSSKSSTRSRVKESRDYTKPTQSEKTFGEKTHHDQKQPRMEEEEDEEESYYDYRYVWATGFFLLIITFVYFYWQSTYECCVLENDVTNMTMQYAIDQFSVSRVSNELKEHPEIQPEIVNS